MKSQFLPISEQQFSRSRREIYMNSIGRLRNKDVSCHIDQDRKRILYEKKQITLSKILHNLVIKFQKDVFSKIRKFTHFTNRQKIDTVFLPEALLKNDRQIIKSFRQKLSVGQIDRYISLNIPKNRSQSLKLQKSQIFGIFKGTTKNKRQKTTQKDVDSTYIDNGQNSYVSKSIEAIKVKQHKDKSNGFQILKFDLSSKGKTNVNKSQISKSNKKKDIIHIKYSEFSLGSQGKTLEPKRELKINEFSLEDPKEVRPKNKNLNQQLESDQFFSSSVLKEIHSPNIGKNRLKNPRLENFSCGKKFESINIEY